LDFDKIINERIEQVSVEEYDAPLEEHGTEIVLTGLKHKLRGSTPTKVRDYLASMYRQLLRSGVVEVTYREQALFFDEIKVLEAKAVHDPDSKPQLWRKMINLELADLGITLKGFAAIRETGKASGSGFTLFRRGRAIQGVQEAPWQPYEIFGGGNSYRSQRLFGEFEVEGLDVAFSKNAFIWEDSEEIVVQRLKEELDADPMPLLKQAESYRAKNPDPSHVAAADKAVKLSSDALAKAAEEDLPGISERTNAQPMREEVFVGGSEITAGYEHRITVNGKEWVIAVGYKEESEDPEWMRFEDSQDEVDCDRKIEITFNLSSNFFMNFSQNQIRVMEPIFRVGEALVAAVVANRSVFENGHVISNSVSEFLHGQLGKLSEQE
jgi:hypothetical protein